ncbi:MAG: hypothetical protein LUD19_01145, partial [Clostridia bacterium]|nr:hypothetical protein [Clostridia bacterium]
MVRLRHTHRTLRIVLACVLGAVVAATGAAGIYLFGSSSLTTIDVPKDSANTKTEVPAGLTPSDAATDESQYCNTLSYLAYVLDKQESYSVYAESTSTALSAIKSTTRTYKDYSNGIMIASDITSGNTGFTPKSAVQTCYIYGSDGSLLAYRRSGSGASSTATPEDITWNNTASETYYYDQETYRSIYGEYSTEMTVYLLNDETVETYTSITDNGDGTYTQSFTLNNKAGYYYQYVMQTNGGLSDLPSFESIALTVTFDASWQVLEIYVEETTVVSMSGVGTPTTKCVATTTFSYGESAINTANYSYYSSYYKDNMANATQGGTGTNTSDGEVQITDLLLSAFADVLDTGDQFAFEAQLGENTYYGLIYLWLDMDTISSDTMNAIKVKVLLSADDNYDTQDLYIEFNGGDLSVYYSDNFAMSVDINEFISDINAFSDWINSYSIGGSSDTAVTASAALAADDSSSFDLTALLGGLEMTENADGTICVSLALDNLYGISAYVAINFSVTETEEETTYTLINAVLTDVSYNGEDIALDLTILPTEVEEVTRDKSQTEYDLSQAAESLYALLDSDLLQLDLTLDGETLYTLLASLLDSSYTEYLSVLNDIDIKASALVDVDGIATEVYVAVVQDTQTLIAIDVYYAYDGSSTYGIAYITLTEFMGAQCDVKVYCDIADVVTSVNSLISAIESYSGTELAVAEEGSSTEESPSAEEGSAEESSDSISIAQIVNTVLGMDFGKLIQEVKADGTTLAVKVDVDYALSLFGVSLGDIALGSVVLDYTYEADSEGNAQSGILSLDLAELGLAAKLSGLEGTVSEPSGDYLDVTELIDSLTLAISGESIALEATLANLSTGTALDNYEIELNAYVIPTSSSVAVQAELTLTNKSGEVLALTVYYAHDTDDVVYVSITNLLGTECTVNIKCTIGEVSDSVSSLLDAINSYTTSAATVSEEGESNSTSSTLDTINNIIDLLINNGDSSSVTAAITELVSIFSDASIDLDTFLVNIVDSIGEIITINTTGSSLTLTANADEIITCLLNDTIKSVTLGDISLTYSVTAPDKADAVENGG